MRCVGLDGQRVPLALPQRAGTQLNGRANGTVNKQRSRERSARVDDEQIAGSEVVAEMSDAGVADPAGGAIHDAEPRPIATHATKLGGK